MSETGDYNPVAWKGHDFTKARKDYDKHVGRSYTDAVADKKRVADLVPDEIKTNSKAPLVIAIDVTGSMGQWPVTMFSKLPYMDNECKEYLGEDMEISFGAVGDAYSDQYPIQIRSFAKGRDMETQLKELVIEGNGGGQCCESYELTALYYARNVKMPKAKRPIMIMIGDESFYDHVSKSHAALANVKIQGADILTKDIFKELQEKYSFYLIRKTYAGGDDKYIQDKWEELIGKENIAILDDPNRVVDVIFGILAKEKGKIDYFKKEIEERQRKDQVDTVYKSLKTIHAIAAKSVDKKSGKSVLHKSLTGTKTKKLLP